MTAHHAVVWIDHNEAKVFKFVEDAVEAMDIHAPPHAHVRKNPDHHLEDGHYLHDVTGALKDCEEILVVGPSTAKLGLIRYLHKHAHELEPRVVGVESVDHPTDGQLVAYARKYFRKVDRMR